MLAYVFAHQPAEGVGAEEYVPRLVGFHRALAAAPPAGFIKSWVWKLGAGPLGEAFEDWYLVTGWAALGTLNQAAVMGQRKEPHDEIAPLAATGAGAIYELVYGAPNMAARYRTRAAKPAGMGYKAFQPRLERAAGADGALWKRQMVLGPDLEFLIDTPSRPHDGIPSYLAEVTALHPIHLSH